MLLKKLEIDWPYWVIRFIFVVAIILSFQLITNFTVITSILKRIFSVLSPFILGFVVAYLLNGAQKNIERLVNKIKLPFIQRKSRGLSILILYTLLIFLFFVTLNYAIPLIVKNISELVALIPSFYNFLLSLETDTKTAELFKFIKIDDILNTLTSSFPPQKIIGQWTNALTSVGAVTKNLASVVLNIFLTFIISIYTLIYKDNLLAFIKKVSQKIFPTKVHNRAGWWITTSNEIFYKFIACQFLDACIIGVLSMILLSVLHVKFAITLGLLLGICNMIPYFGSIFASVLTGIITLFTGGVSLAIGTMISLLILQQIDGNIIGPRIMGGALNINPIIVIISITVGGAYWGVIGMFLAIPVAALLRILFMNWLESNKKESDQENAQEPLRLNESN